MTSILKNLYCNRTAIIKNCTQIFGNKLPSGAQKQPCRFLNVHEHVSYTLLQEAGICVPNFGVAKSPAEAKKIAEELEIENVVLKAQVLTGGRGKGTFKSGLKGGVQMLECPGMAEEVAGKMIGQLLVTKQSGPEGKICNSVMVTEQKIPKKEYYFAIMLERAYNGPVIIASSQGGVNIEEVAEKSPDAIFYQPIDVCNGLTEKQGMLVAEKVGLECQAEKIAEMLMNMYKLFVAKDALLIEINPYAEDCDGEFFALDAKLRFDDNAQFRQKKLFEYRDFTQEDPKEVAAAKFDLNYIALDGSIGCMVNGAGLAMATLDIITLHGGSPANFLDVGGGATADAVKEAFKIITSDPKVKTILVNIFGGIMKCDIIAEGIVAASKELGMKVPIVVRLQGTNVDKARTIIKESGLKIQAEDNLDKASTLAVQLAKGGATAEAKAVKK